MLISINFMLVTAKKLLAHTKNHSTDMWKRKPDSGKLPQATDNTTNLALWLFAWTTRYGNGLTSVPNSPLVNMMRLLIRGDLVEFIVSELPFKNAIPILGGLIFIRPKQVLQFVHEIYLVCLQRHSLPDASHS